MQLEDVSVCGSMTPLMNLTISSFVCEGCGRESRTQTIRHDSIDDYILGFSTIKIIISSIIIVSSSSLPPS